MGLQLDLLVSQSATWKTCNPNGLTPFSITPTFRLSPLQFSSAPTNAQNGFETGLKGVIAAVTGSSFTVTAADGLSCNPPVGSTCSPAAASGPAWQVAAAPNAIFEGITDASHLAIGMPVDMDAAIQPDGSLQASRIAVFDPNPANLSVYSGPLLAVAASEPVLNSFGTEEQGKLLVGGADFFNFGEATFKISNQLTNVSSLPFAASFTAANIVAGQNVDITTHALSVADGPTYVPATTVTLRPQTINGTVSSITKQGNFTVYTVALGPYDLFPELAVQPGQTTLLTDSGTVVIYTDSSTQALSSSPPAVGDVQRFTGIVFNDGGILRMDCASINDGVPE